MAMNFKISKDVERSLNVLLSSECTLYFKTKKAHWLASGQNFRDIHKLLDKQSKEIGEWIDEVAERVTMLGGTPVGSLTEFRETSMLRDFSPDRLDTRQFCSALLEDHERLVPEIRKATELAISNGDPGTSDLMTDLVKAHEKMSWYLRAIVMPQGSPTSP